MTVHVFNPDALDPDPPFQAAADFFRRPDYFIVPEGREALRAAWPYSIAG